MLQLDDTDVVVCVAWCKVDGVGDAEANQLLHDDDGDSDDHEELAAQSDDDDFEFESMEDDSEQCTTTQATTHRTTTSTSIDQWSLIEYQETETFAVRQVSQLLSEAQCEWFSISSDSKADAWHQLRLNCYIDSILRITSNRRSTASAATQRHWIALHEQLLDLLRNRLLLVPASITELLRTTIAVLEHQLLHGTTSSTATHVDASYPIGERDRDYILHLLGLLSSRYLQCTASASRAASKSSSCTVVESREQTIQRQAIACIVDCITLRVKSIAHFLRDIVQEHDTNKACRLLAERWMVHHYASVTHAQC
jgi:hypothetical protein